MSEAARTDLLRPRDAPGAACVTNVELFFDLVFAFAITQLSHALLKDLSVTGALHVLLLFLSVWWLWIFTTWVTNWLDPEAGPVRLALLVLMLVGLVLSTAIPEAFGEMGLVFAGCYALMQVGRSMFMVVALGESNSGNRRNFERITAWLTVSGVIWIGGAFAEGTARLVLWAIALGLEYAAPALGFRFPGLGRSTTADWDVAGGHLAERCSNFVIIALGESVLVTGASFGERPWDAATLAAFASAFIGSVAMWWIYFDTSMERASEIIAESGDPGRLARTGYTYLHLPIVAGIVLCAVADELALAHPDGHMIAGLMAVLVGGPALYLCGNLLFKRTVIGAWRLSHLAGLALLIVLAAVATAMTPLALASATTLVLVVVAAWEMLSLRSRRHRVAIPASNPKRMA